MPVAQSQTPDLPFPSGNEHGSLDYWKTQLEQARQKRNQHKDKEWDINVQAYLGQTLALIPTQDTVTVPKDFANVERKKAELFFQNPDVNLAPKQPGLEQAVHVFQAVLNHQLGPHGVDAGGMMTEVTFDACMTGLLVSKIGYESFADGMQQIPTGQMQPGPPLPNAPGAILGLSTPPAPEIPITQPVPNIIFERYFWERVSPGVLLLPPEFSGFNYDKAAWIGFEFEEDWAVVKRRYQLADDLKPQASKGKGDQLGLKSETDDSSLSSSDKVRGQEIWYRAAVYDPTVIHPEQLRCFVLLNGIEEPQWHRASPYQTMAQGKLMGMKGYPIHVGAVRYVSDTAFPAVETTIGRSQVDELGKSRTQMLLQRDRNVPMRLVDSARIGGEPALDKIRRNVWQSVIPVAGLDANNPPMVELPRSSYPPEDFQFNAIISRDLDEVWAFGPNQRGLETTERKTATEIKNIQQNVSSRLDYERRQIIRFYTRGAEKLGSLIQMFADAQDYVLVVGPDGTQQLQAWNKDTIQGEYAYDARPDSAVRVDAAAEFRDLIEMYNLTGKDPHTNRVELLTKMARLKNLDPQRWVVPQLNPKGPEPPRISFAYKGEMVDPTIPNFPITVEILRQAGFQISDQAIAAAQQHAQAQGAIMNQAAANSITGIALPPTAGGPKAEHEGTAPTMDRLSRHQSDRTHELSGPKTD